MILDKETHRKLLLELIRVTSFPGDSLEIILELKQSIIKATVDKEKTDMDRKKD